MTMRKNAVLGLIVLLFVSFAGFLSTAKTFEAHAAQSNYVDLVQEDMFETTNDPTDVGLPTASTDEISQWTERKGFEIIGLLQKFVQPFAIVIFIGCAIITLIGAFGNGKLVSKGLLGLFISLIMYVVVLYAPEIMDVFLNFVRT